MKPRFLVWKRKIPSPYKSWKEGVIACNDAVDFLAEMRNEVADIVFLDPPFNIGKKYGNKNKKADLITEEEYTVFMHKILVESVRVLKNGGALYLYHLPQWAVRFGDFLDKKMLFRHWIAISMKNGFVRGEFLYPAHYALLYFTKGKPGSFNRPKIPTPRCRTCNEYIKDYGGYKEYVKDGINLSDIWDDLSPVRHSNTKTRSENELPLDFLRRIIHISGTEGGVIVDPFLGSGTTAVAAIEHGMRFLACDRESEYFEGAINRITDFKAGKY